MAHLSIDMLYIAFGTVVILDGFNLTVPIGERHALIGPNGAGKTTLLNAISGWIKPQGGSIRLNNQPLIGQSPHQIARYGMARANQIPQGFPTLTVSEHLKAATHQASGFFQFARQINSDIETLLEMVNLDEVRSQSARQLSHGQRKRLELGCALALDPTFLLLDEPTAGLSPSESEAMVAMLKRIPLTMLVVEHDMDVVAALAERVSVLHGGQVLAQGTPEQIADNVTVQKVYLGHVAS